MKRFGWIGGACLLAMVINGLSAPAEAAPLVYDGFDYAAGSLAGSNSPGWTSAWGSPSGGTLSVTSPGATYPELSVTGNKATITPTSGSTISARSFTSTPITSGTIYFSALFDATNSGTRFFGMQILNGGTEQAFFGKNGGQAFWSMSRPTPSLLLPSAVSSATADQTLLVLRVDFDHAPFGANNYERLSLYVNPAAGDPEPIANVISTQANAFQLSGITGISVGAGFNSSPQTTVTGTIDEVRIGTAWSDVVVAVPEPAGLAVLGLGALALMRRTRLQHAKGRE